ncbi:MAG: TIGR01458 family HAD-type hydrolase [Alphaproteobacteria bacterium]|nr:TIGR01458 family HAD-type hydrolase [Alphaproteobacteria bacterium]
MTALLIDLDGVIYEGDKPVAGAAETVAWIGQERIPHLFLTNTTSRPRAALVEKLADMNVSVTADQILTPPLAAVQWISEHAPGPAALFVAPATRGEFSGLDIAPEGHSDAASVVVGDYGERWNFAELNRAFRLLMARPQPKLVALGMTRYWKAADGLRLDTAPFVMALSYATGAEPVVLGKPAKPFFETALTMLDVGAEQAVMVGDDIKGDIGGARAAGITAVLVKTGKFRPDDLDGDVEPDLVLDSIADLPDCWDAIRV